ncbi:MAG: 4-(cytidine 5'-diphospho)-2-C-methyl-D-erythritol kinase [Lachnospiraceae bacterium]|jgi:4-diphosphocytidyl-2-C-methyl-D-erythritol kinase|nr:4-(cytidine 5'-diphospho)-2-C-methyl-D-erythritol kinase [Lachnospiraceae bacterium]
MKTITRKAYAKLNLGLDVIGRRPDGYHELRMIMQTIDLYDELRFEEIKDERGTVRLYVEDERTQAAVPLATIPANEENLVHRAATAILSRFHPDGAVAITLTKRIPIAAGLGGGSSDAACVFHGLNSLFDLNMPIDIMMQMGVAIGADIPFCLLSGTALATGIGEKLISLPPPPPCHLVIVRPAIAVSTREVFAMLDIGAITRHPNVDEIATAIQQGDLLAITNEMGNVLETVTIHEHPIIGTIKEELVEWGAKIAMMSGSGPSVFAIFTDKKQATLAYKEMKKHYEAYQAAWVDVSW